mgnify:CR=1 FL=1
MDEFELIKNYFQKISNNNPYAKKLNDDVFFDKKNSIVVSVDTYNEGTHFINFNKPSLVIKKILRSSISDLVCKGVYPKYYFISASGNKKSFRNFNLKKIVQSLRAEQNKYKIFLGGGDTVFSDKLSFTIISLGISKGIIYRNKAKFKDDIYVTGNLGDSYVGLLALKNKIQVNVALKKYFVNKYYLPNIKFSLIKNLKKIANTSIDISDGLFADMEKLINNQKLSYQIFLEKIPISSNLSKILKKKKLLKENFISNGDDYEILFTANTKNRNLIKKIAKKSKTKITRIGYIKKNTTKSSVLNALNSKIILKNKGYFHSF